MRAFGRGSTTVSALVAIAFALTACGGDDAEEDSGASDEQGVAAAIDAFYEGIATADGELACGALTDDAVTELTTGSELTCEDAIAQIDGLLNDEAKQALQDAEPEITEIDGDSATAEVPVISQAAAGADAEVEQETGEVTLVKDGDEWKLSTLP